MKWIKDLNIRPETVKLLQENIGKKFPHTGLGKSFFGYNTSSISNKKAKINKLDYIKQKSFSLQRKPPTKLKGNL